MTQARIINAEIRAGVWTGELTGAGNAHPDIKVTHRDTALDDVSCTHESARDTWLIKAPIPAKLISDGLQTFHVMNAGHVIADFSLLAGEALASDLEAEIALIRSELDILKAAFRKHCAES